MTDEELGRLICRNTGVPWVNYMVPAWYAKLGAVARELLAPKVATREEVHRWVCSHGPAFTSATPSYESIIMAALSHFAPPRQRMMIEGMSVAQIAANFWALKKLEPSTTEAYAAEAHRLSTTPVPEVDPDAENELIGHKILMDANSDVAPLDRISFTRQYMRSVGRAVAAKEAGDA